MGIKNERIRILSISTHTVVAYFPELNRSLYDVTTSEVIKATKLEITLKSVAKLPHIFYHASVFEKAYLQRNWYLYVSNCVGLFIL